MRKDWARYGLMVMVLAAVTALLGTFALRGEDLRRPRDESTVQPEVIVQQQAPMYQERVAPMYRLSVWQGRVAVFDGETGELLRVTEMPYASLPEPDQLALEQGIDIRTQTELAQLLEDYGS